MQKQLLIGTIHIDGGTQSRAAINDETVAEYAEAIQAGAKLPPILVFFDGTTYWAADGFHRILAHIKAGKANILADVQRGAKDSAIWASVGSNLSHGLRRSNDDKIQATTMALSVRPDLSDEAIGQHCGVHRQTVLKVRHDTVQVVEDRQPHTRTGTDGKKYPVPTPRAKSPAISAPLPPSVPPVPPQPTIPPAPPAPKAPSPATKTTPEKGKATTTPPPGPVHGQKDATGHPIPDCLLELWERRREVEELMKSLSVVKCAIERAGEAADPVFGELNASAALANLKTVYGELSACRPHAVCPWCHGVLSDQCRVCKGRGMIGKFLWDNTVPTTLKAGRE